jgi:hypothetical protein
MVPEQPVLVVEHGGRKKLRRSLGLSEDIV